MHLDRALRDAFDRKSPKRFPAFYKKFVCTDSLRYPQGFRLDGDLGVARFLTLSDATVYRPLNFLVKLAGRLAREQRRLARKVKGSRNWLRQKAAITRMHIRIADARSDYLHKVSSAVSKNHAVVVLEELRMANMSASARGTLLAPGCRVRQKGGLNRAILDQGWGEFTRQLEYNESWLGGLVLCVDAACTSQKCSRCGQCAPGNRTGQASFACLSSRLGGPCRRQRGTEHSGGGARRHRLWRARRSRAARRSRNLRSRCGASRIGPWNPRRSGGEDVKKYSADELIVAAVGLWPTVKWLFL